MRGNNDQQAAVMLYITPDQKVPQDHPIRALKPIVDRALTDLSPLFNQVQEDWTPLDSTRASAQGQPANRLLLGAE